MKKGLKITLIVIGTIIGIILLDSIQALVFDNNPIIVLNDGELIQQGKHDCLVEDKNGKYYEMWNAQAQYYQ